MIPHKKSALLALALIIGLFSGLPALLVFLVDPCHIFHRPFPGIFSHGFSMNPRCQTAGLINTYLSDTAQGYDSILTGTSLSTNYSESYIKEATKWEKTLKLSVFGAKPIEQKIFTLRALQSKNVRHVFWEVVPFQFLRAKDTIADLQKTKNFPLYLYNKSRIDDYQYVFNSEILSNSIDELLNIKKENSEKVEKIYYAHNQCTKAKTCEPLTKKEDLDVIKANYKSTEFLGRTPDEISEIDFSTADKLLLDALLSYCNTEISFDLIFPPLSMLFYSAQNQEDFDYQLYMLRYVVVNTSRCKNVRSFAFNNELWITGDLAHYQDERHFYGDVHDYIIQSTESGKHIMTIDNVADFERQFIENMNNYTPRASTAEQIQASNHL